MPKRPKPIVLTVLDGWGYREERENNAIALARTPNYDQLCGKYPWVTIATSGEAVGLPQGQMGNSEVGHLNIGAGRIVHMDITRLDLMIANGEFFQNELLLQAMARGRERQLHLVGLVSDGGVHSHINHLMALLKMAQQNKVERVFVQAIMDGRDTSPTAGVDYLRQLEQKMREYGTGQIATVTGRYFAMDRDNRWPRIEKAYCAMVHGEAAYKSSDPIEALRRSYDQGVTDEFVLPIVITGKPESGKAGKPRGRIQDEDAVIFFNFRADRARQTTRALAEPNFDKFVDPKRPKNLFFVTMTQYDKTFTWVPYVIGQQEVENILANVFSGLGFRNLRVAETEKYAHVTYFFNGGVEKPFPGEERILVPSPKVPTYDLQPEMSAAGVAETVVKAIEKGDFDAIIMNFANADMVGHSGKLEAAIKAVEAVDACLGRIYRTMAAKGGAWIVTADHGNAELMLDPVTGGPHTAHTTNPVPFVCLTDNAQLRLRPGGSLRDVSPTLLGILGIPQPKEMTGCDLRMCP